MKEKIERFKKFAFHILLILSGSLETHRETQRLRKENERLREQNLRGRAILDKLQRINRP